ncbi:hypothetical protein O9992_27455 [Vibrio lentus]|nr:hypothetical protein [Vibrio lentus]
MVYAVKVKDIGFVTTVLAFLYSKPGDYTTLSLLERVLRVLNQSHVINLVNVSIALTPSSLSRFRH